MNREDRFLEPVTPDSPPPTARPPLAAGLQPLAAEVDEPAFSDRLVGAIQQWLGCRSVGLRLLLDDGSLAYAAQVGFGASFWLNENLLLTQDDSCACTRVALGRLQPQDQPALTPAGSFYAADLPEFIGQLSEEELGRYRGRCPAEGFKSLAIVPLFNAGSRIGILHLADDRIGYIDQAAVSELEACSATIGELLSHHKALEHHPSRFATPLGMDAMLQGIDVIAYVADPESREMLYANPTLRKLLPPDHLGKPCHWELHGKERACATCSTALARRANPLLKERVYRTPQGEQRYLVIDRLISWADGRDVWLCFGVALH